MKRRFIGNATRTPTHDITTIQITICHHGTITPVINMYAARLEMSGVVMYPAAVAIDCIALFSSMVKSFAIPIRAKLRKMAKARITEVRPTPRVTPVFPPM